MVGGYCVDPNGETKAYGEKAKFSMDEVCTTAFDGECEVYKSYGLKRVVRFNYVEGAGLGGVVEVTLSQFEKEGGAYGMFTKRVVAADPADKMAPRVLAAKAQGAMGTGRAYVWRGVHLVELQYNNDRESPEALAKSSAVILSQVGKEIGDKLPGGLDRPGAAMLLPSENLIPNGIEFFLKDPMGISSPSGGAAGYYKEGDKRYRVVAIRGADVEQAKDVMKSIAKRGGGLPMKDMGDESVFANVQVTKDSPKLEFVFARKGDVIFGAGDEEYAIAKLKGDALDKARLGKDFLAAKVKSLIAQPAPAASGAASSASKDAGSAPKK
jgi:hypothetical protein